MLAARGQSRGPEADDKITDNITRRMMASIIDNIPYICILIYLCHCRRRGVTFHINARTAMERHRLCNDEAAIVPFAPRCAITPSTTFCASSQQHHFATNCINAKVFNALKYRQTASTASVLFDDDSAPLCYYCRDTFNSLRWMACFHAQITNAAIVKHHLYRQSGVQCKSRLANEASRDGGPPGTTYRSCRSSKVIHSGL
jgi:hypothetical protein